MQYCLHRAYEGKALRIKLGAPYAGIFGFHFSRIAVLPRVAIVRYSPRGGALICTGSSDHRRICRLPQRKYSARHYYSLRHKLRLSPSRVLFSVDCLCCGDMMRKHSSRLRLSLERLRLSASRGEQPANNGGVIGNSHQGKGGRKATTKRDR